MPNVNIALSDFSGVVIENYNQVLGTTGDDTLTGTAGDDDIVGYEGNDLLDGGAGDDNIYTGGGAYAEDTVMGSAGSDLIDLSQVDSSSGYVVLDYGSLAGPINVAVDGGESIATVAKGADTDTIVSVENPLFAGWADGGLLIAGTAAADTFDLNIADQQWMELRPGDGVDQITLSGAGLVRLDFRGSANGIDVDLSTNSINDDGFGNAETIIGNTPWGIRGSEHGDVFVGSSGNDKFRKVGGNDTLDGGDGQDRIRYDANGLTGLEVDLAAGTATGSINGTQFTDTISNFEHVRGSSGDDWLAGDSTGVNNLLEGRGGADTFVPGTGFTYIGQFAVGVSTLDVARLGVTIAEAETALQNATQIDSDAVVNLPNGSTIQFAGLSTAQVANITPVSSGGVDQQIQGTAGDDTLSGGAGNDILIGNGGNDYFDPGTGDDVVQVGESSVFDESSILAGEGNDTFDFSGMVGGYASIDYSALANAIDVTIDGVGNTGSALKGASGTDTYTEIDNPLIAGNTTGGLGIIGTQSDDTLDLTLDATQWMQVQGQGGNDTITINSGLVRIDYSQGGAIVADLAAGTVQQDGFTDTIAGAQGAWEIRGSDSADSILGSANDESFILRGGNDTLDGGDGFDRLRYDRGGYDSGIDADLATGAVAGTWNGNSFTHVVSNIEYLRGSNHADTLAGDANDNQLQGRGGIDTFVHVGGNDTISDFDALNETLIVRIGGLNQTDIDTALSGATDVNGDALVSFGSSSVLFSGLSAAQIASIDAQYQNPAAQNTIQGTSGDDLLEGTAGNDLIITDDATAMGDTVVGSAGDDTIDMSGMNQTTAWALLNYGALAGTVDVTIDGVANTGSALKSTLGTDTYTGIVNPLNAGNSNGGVGIVGTQSDDTFDLTLDATQWMMVQGQGGNDTITINSGTVRIDYSQGGAIVADLTAGTVTHDGFTDTIAGAQGAWEIRGSDSADSILGSANDESFILRGGNDTLDGGDGFDRLRYDQGIYDGGIDADLAQGEVTGNALSQAGSTPFTHSISNIEHLRGTNSNDRIAGDTGDNRLEGRGGDDTFTLVGGNDTVDGGAGNDSVYFNVNEAQAAVTSDGQGNHSVTIGVDTITLTSIEELLFADSGATPPPPPSGPSAWTIGDPHLLTLDGLGYDFHAVGEYVLLRGQTGQDVNGFEIQSRMTETLDDLGNPVPNVSVNAAIAMRAANGSEVMIDSTDASPLSVDGVVQALADGEFLEVGNDRVYRVGDTYTTVFAGSDDTLNAGDTQVSVVVHSGRVDLSVRISSELAGKLEGLLGDGDGDKTNDVARADGTVLLRPLAFEDLYGGYRDDWRVDDETQSLFTYDTGETLAGFYDPSKPGSITTVDDFTALDQQAAQQAAESAGLQPGTVNYDNAVLDFLLTGDQSFVDGAANEDVAAPETATVTGTLDQGQTRTTLDISVTDRNGDAVEGAQIGFSSGSSTARTAADDLSGGSYQVQLGEGTSGSAGGSMEFTNASNTITSADALDVLRLAVGLNPSWGAAVGMDFVAADVTRDGQVTSADALEVLRAAVGLDSPAGTAPKWVFLDQNLDVSGADRTSVPVAEGVDIAAIDASGALASLNAVLLGDRADFNAI